MKDINKIGYCGLYCPECYRMKVSGAAKALKLELENAQSRGAKYIDDCGAEFMDKLNYLIKLHCNEFCRDRKEMKCDIWHCCREKRLEGCWQCLKFEKCDKLKPQFIAKCREILSSS